MAGYVIHLAIAEEYMRKHEDEIKDIEKFLEGAIAPDGVEDKLKSHYGKKENIDSLKKFLEINKKDIDDDFIKGYFIHLLTDYIFYNKYFGGIALYNDYDITNKILIDKYNVKIPDRLNECVKYTEGEPEHLKYNLLYEIIDKITRDTIKENIEKIERGEDI